MQPTNPSSSFRLELIAMVAVIAISSWHVGNYMNTFDGWLMATIMGATLGFCNFLMAHNIFKPNTTTRLPSFCGLVFFACTSTYMQYTYFNGNNAIGKTMFLGLNLDALALGSWAPAAEILLGWIYAAGLTPASSVRTSHSLHPSKFERLTEALTGQLERRLSTPPVRSLEQSEHNPNVQAQLEQNGDSPTSVPIPFPTVPQVNGQTAPGFVHHTQLSEHLQPSLDTQPVPVSETPVANGHVQPLSKDEALAHILAVYRRQPTASYEEIGRQIGRSKATVANYVKELKQQRLLQITDGAVAVAPES